MIYVVKGSPSSGNSHI